MVPKAFLGPYPSMWAVSVWPVYAHTGTVVQCYNVTHDPSVAGSHGEANQVGMR